MTKESTKCKKNSNLLSKINVKENNKAFIWFNEGISFSSEGPSFVFMSAEGCVDT